MNLISTNIIQYNIIWGSLRFINREAVYKKVYIYIGRNNFISYKIFYNLIQKNIAHRLKKRHLLQNVNVTSIGLLCFLYALYCNMGKLNDTI